MHTNLFLSNSPYRIRGAREPAALPAGHPRDPGLHRQADRRAREISEADRDLQQGRRPLIRHIQPEEVQGQCHGVVFVESSVKVSVMSLCRLILAILSMANRGSKC